MARPFSTAVACAGSSALGPCPGRHDFRALAEAGQRAHGPAPRRTPLEDGLAALHCCTARSISGVHDPAAPGSGKTTLLNAVIELLLTEERIVVCGRPQVGKQCF